MKKTWLFFSNTFDVNTRKLPGRMLKIGNDHDSRLSAEKADPDILELWNVFNPLILVFRTLFSLWKSSISNRMSATLKFNKLLSLLSGEWIRAWEGKVFYHYPEGTPESMAIFPNKRSPFQIDNYEERIQNVQTLADSMKPYEPLAEVVRGVEAKYALLLAARDEQKQAMQTEAMQYSQLEALRLQLAKNLYRNLAILMAKYFEEPTQGERFFNESLIRRPSSDVDTTFSQSNKVNPGASLVIQLPKKFELGINATFFIANSDGGGELYFLFSDSAATTDSPQKAVALPGDAIEAKAGEMGWSESNNILIVRNVGTVTAEYEMTVTE